MKRTCVKVIPQRARADRAPLPVLMPVMVTNPDRDIPEDIQKYVGRKLGSFSTSEYESYKQMVKDLAELQKDQFESLESKIGTIKDTQSIRIASQVGPAIKKYMQKSKKINDYIRKEVDKHIIQTINQKTCELSGKVSELIFEEIDKLPTQVSNNTEQLEKLEEKLERLDSGYGGQRSNVVKNFQSMETRIERLKIRIEGYGNDRGYLLTDFNKLSSNLDRKLDRFKRIINPIENKLTEIEEKYLSTERIVEHESNNFPESSQELTNSNYSLEDVIADAKKPKIKKRRGKENKITLIYDSPNPAKVELRPKDIGSLELTIFSRGMDAQEIREKTLVFDPYNPETNEKNVEIFLDEVDTHYANNTLDSLITSLNNPGLAEYFGKNMSPHFKKIYDLMTDELNSEFKGENKDLTSNLLRVKVEKNKKRSGYGAFSSGKKLFGAISPILFPMKLLPYVGRLIE